MIKYFIFSLVNLWIFGSLFAAFAAVNVFKNISNTKEAASVGMAIFGTFNLVEIFFGLAIAIGSYFKMAPKLFKFITWLLVLFPLYYTFSLTPKIKESARLKYSSYLVDEKKFDLHEKNLNYYHKQYELLDKVKLVLLLILLISFIKNNKSKKLIEVKSEQV